VLRTPVKMVAAALVAGLALTACGPVKLGAAAVMSNDRISASALSAQVSNLNRGYEKYKGKIQLQFQVSQMPQEVLSWLIRFRVRDEMAARNGINVTPGQVEAALKQITQQSRSTTTGVPVPLPALAVANGLPPDMLDDLARYQAIQTVLINRLDGGQVPGTPTGQQAISRKFSTFECHAAKSLNIRISPQYGRLDYSQYAVVAAPSSVSAAGGASPSPSPSPSSSTAVQLTPHC
jgi:hypothetical protein